MTCNLIRTPNGGVAIVCGPRRRMSKSEKAMTEGQTAFIEKTRKAAARCAEMAAEADKLDMPILAREWSYLGNELESKCAMQIRAFRDNALAEK